MGLWIEFILVPPPKNAIETDCPLLGEKGNRSGFQNSVLCLEY